MLNNNTRKTSARVYLLALLSADKLISITDDNLIERKGVKLLILPGCQWNEMSRECIQDHAAQHLEN